MGTFRTVQALRGVAAVLVVAYHGSLLLQQRLGWGGRAFDLGASGVDIFFAISGFVMILTTAGRGRRPGAWREFLRRRLLRIVPLYWLVTLARLAALGLAPGAALHAAVAPWHTVASLLFIPARSPQGYVGPLVPVGWTLNVEVFFYLLFAAVMAAGRRPLVWVPPLLAAAFVVGLFRTDDWPAVTSLFHPMVAEFPLGMAVGGALLAGRRLPERWAPLTAAAAILAMVASSLVPGLDESPYRVLLYGAPGALLLASLVAMEDRWGRLLSGFPARLGAASYSLYLTHGFVQAVVGVAAARLHMAGPAGLAAAFATALLAPIPVSLAVHRWVEEPLGRVAGAAMRFVPGGHPGNARAELP